MASFPTSYIPTTTAAVTRAADVPSITGSNFSSWYRQDEGTMFADCVLNAATASGPVIYDIGAGGAFGTTAYVFWNGSAWNLNPNTPPVSMASSVTTTASAKIAAGMKSNDSALSANSLIGVTDSACNMPSSATTMTLGNGGWSGAASRLNGHIRRFTYFPQRLPNSILQSLTS